MLERMIIIFFSSLSLPYLIGLIRYLAKSRNQDKENGNEFLSLLLMILFSALFIISISSIAVSANAIFNSITGSSFFHSGSLSRLRSVFFAVVNFLVSYYFHKTIKK